MQLSGADNCRLVLFDGQSAPMAAVYPLDANPYTEPDFVFAVDALQELPAVAPGSPARIDDDRVVHQAGIAVRPAGRIEREPSTGLRMFGELGDVLKVPDSADSNSWKYRASDSALDVDALARLERSRIRECWGMAAFCGTFVAGFVAIWVVTGRPPSLTAGWGTSASACLSARRAGGGGER